MEMYPIISFIGSACCCAGTLIGSVMLAVAWFNLTKMDDKTNKYVKWAGIGLIIIGVIMMIVSIVSFIIMTSAK